VTVLVDGRPPGLNAFFRPGDPFTLELTWPTGTLAGRTFTATLGALALDVTINSDVMSIAATAAQTTATTAPVTLILTEAVVGDDVTVIVGTWAPSSSASTYASADVTVTVATAAASVTVASVGATFESNLVDEAIVTTSSGALSVNAFAMSAVPNTVVTVPNLTRPVLFIGRGRLAHSVANSEANLIVAPDAASPAAAAGRFGSVFLPTTAARATAFVSGSSLPANTPGNYRLWVHSPTTGNVTVDASANHETILQVIAL
jgi:hypothetical protein